MFANLGNHDVVGPRVASARGAVRRAGAVASAWHAERVHAAHHRSGALVGAQNLAVRDATGLAETETLTQNKTDDTFKKYIYNIITL